jgi:hypothetical protein
MATGWAILGGGIGSVADGAYCKTHHGDEPTIIFGPCFLYAAAGTATGWFGGSIVGATVGATSIARKRGCSPVSAIVRAFSGAMLGALPGIVLVAPQTGKYPSTKTAFILAAPLLSGVGAAAAVANCHH